jgi:hypothetical protein
MYSGKKIVCALKPAFMQPSWQQAFVLVSGCGRLPMRERIPQPGGRPQRVERGNVQWQEVCMRTEACVAATDKRVIINDVCAACLRAANNAG